MKTFVEITDFFAHFIEICTYWLEREQQAALSRAAVYIVFHKMRLPYAPINPVAPSSPSTQASYTQISARRAPQPLQALDLTLLHAPPVASGWSSFLGSIRTQTSLSPDIREICICRVAALNGAEYEWEHHAPILQQEGKVGDRAMEEVRTGILAHEQDGAEARHNGNQEELGLNEQQWAVLNYTDAMTRNIKVPDPIFTGLRQWFNEREIVEITATIAAYNCVSRFLVALDVGEMSQRDHVPTVEEANGQAARENSAEVEHAWLRGAEMGIWE